MRDGESVKRVGRDGGGCVTGFRLLGPVELWVAGRPVELGPAKRRTVLAALLVDAGRWVPAETLIDRVWGGSTGAGAGHVVRACRSDTARARGGGGGACRGLRGLRTRRGFPDFEDSAGSLDSRPAEVSCPAPVLVRGPAGYRLDVTPGLVDAHRFRDLVARARRTEVPDAVRVLTLREAMGLWRGTPLAGLTGEWAGRTRESWLHQYVDAVLAWADAELRVGGHLVVIDTLSGLVAEHPLVEPLTVALMRALHAAGRTPRHSRATPVSASGSPTNSAPPRARRPARNTRPC